MMKTKALTRLCLLVLLLFGLGYFYSSPASETTAATLKREKLTVTTTGSAGSATGSATSGAVICGTIRRVDVDYHASAPATTDLTLKEVDDLIDTSIVSKSNSATDAQYLPTIQLTANDGTARTMDGTRPLVDYYPVCDRLTVSLAQSDALTPAVTIEIYWQEQK